VIATPLVNVAPGASQALGLVTDALRIPLRASGGCPAGPGPADREPPQQAQEVAHLIRESQRKSGALTVRISKGLAALGRGEYEGATRAFEEAASRYGSAERVARGAMRADQVGQQQRLAQQARALLATRRSLAEDANAEAAAAETWAAAVTRADDGERALARADYTEAARAFAAASGLFRQAEDVARRAMDAPGRGSGEPGRRAGSDEPTSVVDRTPLEKSIPPEAPSSEDSTVLIQFDGRTSALPAPKTIELTSPADPTLVARMTTVSGTGGSEQGILPAPGGDGAGVAEGSGGSVLAPVNPEQLLARRRSAARPSRPLVAGVAVVVLLGIVSGWLLFRPGDRRKVAVEGQEAARMARAEAETFAAPKNAVESWDRARRLESEAEQAFGRGDFDSAGRSFALARTGYQEAKTAAERLRTDAAQERTKATHARKTAVEAGAPERAKMAFDEAVEVAPVWWTVNC
jgi:hypothetical protein